MCWLQSFTFQIPWSCLRGTCRPGVYSWMKPGYESAWTFWRWYWCVPRGYAPCFCRPSAEAQQQNPYCFWCVTAATGTTRELCVLAAFLDPGRAQDRWLFSKSEGVMMWEILVLKVFLRQYFYVPEIRSAGELAMGDAALQAHVEKGASQPQCRAVIPPDGSQKRSLRLVFRQNVCGQLQMTDKMK